MPDRLTPYPWDRLPRVTANQARTATVIARWVATFDAPHAAEITHSLLGCRVELLGIAHCDRRPNPHAPTLEVDGDAHFVIELGGLLAAWIVDRALGGDAHLGRLDAGPNVRNEAARGVLAYVASRVLQTLPGHHPVTEVFADATALMHVHNAPAATCFAMRLLWDRVEAPIHIWMLRAPSAPRGTSHHPRLRRALLQERVVFSAQLMSRPVLRVSPSQPLLIDDVVPLSAPEMAHGPQGYAGRVQLMVLGQRSHVWIGHLRDQQIELKERYTMEHDGLTTGTLLSPSASRDALTPIADAPLELSVEIARFTLPLAEIASLTTGEVLLTGRPVGQHVTLRAGTRAIATGELVNVEGTLGVRILALAGT